MVTVDQLKSQGWCLSSEALKTLSNNGSIQDVKLVVRSALDSDLKDVGSNSLANELQNNYISLMVLQVQKLRNISATKCNEDSQAAPRMLKLTLTDGHTHCQAVEIEQINGLHHQKTPPGTKVLIKNAKIVNGFILIDPSSCNILGGKVQALYERWELAKSVTSNTKHRMTNSGSDGPPAWVNFGQKIITSLNNGNFKSLDKGDEAKQNSEFEEQRKGAIAEAASIGVKKVFGGGTKQSLQNNVSQNRRDKQTNGVASFQQRDQTYAQRSERNSRKGRKEPREKEEKPQRPSENISLFDFLATKITVEHTPTSAEAGKVINDYKGYNQRPNNQKYQSKGLYQTHNKPQVSANSSHQYSNIKPPRFTSGSNRNEKSQTSFISNHADFPSHNSQNQRKQGYNSFGNREDNRYQNTGKSQQYEVNTYNPHVNVGSTNNPSSNIERRDARNQNANIDKRNSATNNTDNVSEQLGKMNLNSEFASRSFRQHLGLGIPAPRKNPQAQQENSDAEKVWTWRTGDQCMAKYWEDGKYYRATVTDITQKTCVVQFNEYGNIEEVLSTDCIPITTQSQEAQFTNVSEGPTQQFNQFQGGSMEFRRGGNRPYANHPNDNKQFYKPKSDRN